MAGNWGDQNWGEGNWGGSQTYEMPTEIARPTYLEAPDFPLRFLASADLVFVSNERAIHNDIMLTVFVRENGIPLVPLGIGIDEAVFDPNDKTLHDWLFYRIKDGISLGVDGVTPLDEMVFAASEENLRVAVPYYSQKSTQQSMTFIDVPVAKVS